MNIDKFKGKLKEKRTSCEKLAATIGMSSKTFYNRLNNGRFRTSDAEKIAIALDLTLDEFLEIFFENLVTSDVTKKEV